MTGVSQFIRLRDAGIRDPQQPYEGLIPLPKCPV